MQSKSFNNLLNKNGKFKTTYSIVTCKMAISNQDLNFVWHATLNIDKALKPRSTFILSVPKVN